MLSKDNKRTARRLAAEWARRYYADAVADAGRVADAERAIRENTAAQEDSAAQFLVASKSEFVGPIDHDDIWRLFWPKATEELKKRLKGGVGARRNPEPERENPEAFVPRRGRASGSDGLQGTLNINTATAAQFKLLPGIGPRVAQQIVQLRRSKANGKFSNINVLRDEVDGIGVAVFTRIAPHLSLTGETSLSVRLVPQQQQAQTGGGLARIGATLRVRFETDLGVLLKELEVTCSSSKPREVERCARTTIEKHAADPALRDSTRAVAVDTSDGEVVLSLSVKHCAECELDGKPQRSDVALVRVVRDGSGYRIKSLFDSADVDVTEDFRELTVWETLPDLDAVESLTDSMFPEALVKLAPRGET